MDAAATNISLTGDSAFDVVAVLESALEEVVGGLQAAGGWISLVREDTLELACHRGITAECAASIASTPSTEGPTGLALTSRDVVVVPDTILWPPPLAPREGEGGGVLLVVPLEGEARALGVLAIASGAPHVHSQAEIDFVRATASKLAAAVEHALLLREQLKYIERQHRLLEAAETISRSIDSGALEATILAEATRLMDAQKSALLAVRGDVLVATEVFGLSERSKELFVVPLEGSPLGQAVLSRGTIVVRDTEPDATLSAELGGVDEWRVMLATSLQSYRGTYGAICLFFDHPRDVREQEQTLFRTFAAHATISLDNRRLMLEKDHMAVHDGLTGVYNRSYLELALGRASKEVRRNGGTAGVLFLDVDGMKQTNDTFGHQAGDTLLCDLAALLQDCCRETDIVARYGGDEFVVLMPGADEEGAKRVAAKIEAIVAGHNNAVEPPRRLSVSMGLHCADGRDIDGLLQEADRRMYAIKRLRTGDGG
jgi:diguanylate cyclase (GGDEF)-like protein